MKKILLALELSAVLMFAGCAGMYQQDEQTGEFGLSEQGEEVVAFVDAVSGVAAATSVLIPGAAAIAGLLAGVAGAMRSYKSKVEAAKNETDTYVAATESIVIGLEAVKEQYPEIWEKIAPVLDKFEQVNSKVDVKAIVDAIQEAVGSLSKPAEVKEVK